ncbi:MAG TPA: hypothetical protein VF644_17750 [Pyrinomonadaceae bacterium]|jgi:hypothetical protein
MAIHEGDANRRLASEAIKILLLPRSEVPEKYKKTFHKLANLIESTIKNSSAPGLRPVKLNRIQNRTAAKYTKLLLTIENELRE